MLSNKSLNGAIIFSFLKKEYKKKPTATIANLKDKAANGEASWTIIFPDIKAEDQSKIKNNGKNLII